MMFVNVDSLQQYDAWFMLGSAAFRSEKWETAIRAFRRCTNLDPEVILKFQALSLNESLKIQNFETWNNLAAAYIKVNKK